MTLAAATPSAPKGRPAENRNDLDTEGNDPPILPAIGSPKRKVDPALRAFDDLKNAAQGNNTQE